MIAQSVALGLAGGVLGVRLAMTVLCISSVSLGAEAVTIAFTPSLWLALWRLLTAAVSGLLAGLAPAIVVARAEIVTALRAA